MTALPDAPPAVAPPRPPGRSASPRSRGPRLVRTALAYVCLLTVALLVLVPFASMVSSSLKRNNEVLTVPVEWVPREFRWSNFVEIWDRIPMTTYLGNSVFLSGAITLLQLLTGSFAAYGFSKVRFPGRDALFLAYIATIAVPWQAYMVPQYIMMQRAELTNTYWSIILLQAFGAFGVFLMRQYYMSIPDDLCEAARIDGLSEYGIYWRIMLPLSKPALASLALLTFVNTWNDYMGPFIYLTSNELWTVQLGLRSFVGQYDTEYAMIMTGAVLSVLPIVVLFLIGQRYFIRGIATSGLK
ncbi:carbohydrate ABC transporter permease [Microbispora triticiradicis]|uniref:Carbohydrate ABC transporter permease n=3 Tax=Microbispora TaxID=2005 RepID=A0ABY3LU96_9ACTN|nr:MULTISPECIES: carbohydrate ABC transporter permease [Microbispora]RGA06362.1 carbohydrate ABC transporter permease [Microbispora triticiradicis]TLP52161.1 carbohydrate ABC transporter permease [Microbispora fusca]TYB54436.1 carbohydrate ABC transporter permease [Microbispora tritici]GLW25019.1 sugar ABC transporter ATP-binding protein [Microbispora amethystogenes]